MPAKQLGTIAMIGVGWFVVAVLALHVVEPDFSVVNNYISEYALGESGWLMQSAFFGIGFGVIAIALGLRQTLAPGKRVTASVVVLLIAGIGFFVAAIFKTDPTGATETTTDGNLHLVGSVMIFFSLLAVAWMLRGVFKRDPTWEAFAKAQMWFAIVYTVSMVVTFGTPPGGPVGVTQRLFVTLILGWLLTLAWNIRRHGPAREPL